MSVERTADECKGDISELLQFFTRWVQTGPESNLSMKACIASRDEMEIRLHLGRYPTFGIQIFTSKEISHYVTTRLVEAWNLVANQPHSAPLEIDLELIGDVKKAEGVFIWVVIVVSELVLGLQEERKTEELQQLLYSFPEGLEGLYDKIIEKIDRRYWEDTINSLRIIRELQETAGKINCLLNFSAANQDPKTALSCRASCEVGFSLEGAGVSICQCARARRQLQRRCRGLVTVVEDPEEIRLDKISLLHRTLWEYVIQGRIFGTMLGKVNETKIFDPSISCKAMSLRLVKCVPGLIQYDLDDVIHVVNSPNNGNLSEQTRLFFGVVYEVEHRTQTAHTKYVDELDRCLSLLDPNWASRYNGDPESWNTDLLSLAVQHNLFYYLDQQIQLKGKGILRKAYGRPLLFYVFDDKWLVDLETRQILGLLLENDADPREIFASDTAWLAFSRFGFRYAGDGDLPELGECLELMLEHGADPAQPMFCKGMGWRTELPDVCRDMVYTTTLHLLLTDCVRALGYEEEERVLLEVILQLLVDYSSDLEATDSDGNGISRMDGPSPP